MLELPTPLLYLYRFPVVGFTGCCPSPSLDDGSDNFQNFYPANAPVHRFAFARLR
jgi:hypothetical protein